MPIQTVKRGEHTFREAEFGTGDIAVVGGRSTGNDGIQDMLLLMQREGEHPIGDKVTYDEDCSTDALPMLTEPISLYFTKPESVRVVIQTLEKVEKDMLGVIEINNADDIRI